MSLYAHRRIILIAVLHSFTKQRNTVRRSSSGRTLSRERSGNGAQDRELTSISRCAVMSRQCLEVPGPLGIFKFLFSESLLLSSDRLLWVSLLILFFLLSIVSRLVISPSSFLSLLFFPFHFYQFSGLSSISVVIRPFSSNSSSSSSAKFSRSICSERNQSMP